MENNEISLKEIILIIKEYTAELIKSWWKIVLITIPFLGLYIWKTYNTPSKYFAETKFFLEGDSGSGAGIGGLLGQFGLKGGSDKNNPYKILEVANSKMLLKEILFEKNKNGTFLANLILNKYNLTEVWTSDKENFIGFSFKHDSISKFTMLEKIALLKLNTLILNNEKGSALRTISYDEDKGMYSIKSNTLSEEVSLQLTEFSYNKLKEYFEELSVSTYKENRDFIKNKADSLDALVKSKMFQVGRFLDTNRDLISIEKATSKQILEKEVTVLSLTLAEAYKSYELADFSYRNKRPHFIIIDQPIQPIIPESQSLIINMILGLIIGIAMGSTWVICRRLYINIMKE